MFTGGVKLQAKVEIPSVINMGTVEDPIAGMMILINWQISNVFHNHGSSANYFVQGDGDFKVLSFENP